MRPSTLMFVTEALPAFTLNVELPYPLTAFGGAPPYKFEITQGTLPSGMRLQENGTFAGAPTEPARTHITVQLSDAAGTTATREFNVYVVAP